MSISRRKILAARLSLEQLSTSCLSAAVIAIMHRRTEVDEEKEFPTERDAADAGRIAADMALAIRQRVGRHVDDLLTTEGANEYLDQLAADLLEGKPPRGLPDRGA